MEYLNSVVIVGRIADDITETTKVDGSAVFKFRVVVPRKGTPVTVDAIDVRTTRKAHAKFVAGDVVRIEGKLQRTFWKGSNGVASVTAVIPSSVKKVWA